MGKEIQNMQEIQASLEQLQGLARVRASAKRKSGSETIEITIHAEFVIKAKNKEKTAR